MGGSSGGHDQVNTFQLVMAYYLIHYAKVEYAKFIYSDLINIINSKKRKNMSYMKFVSLVFPFSNKLGRDYKDKGTRGLLAQSSFPQRFRHFAFHTTIYLINRMSSRTSPHKSPFEHLLKRSPDYSFF